MDTPSTSWTLIHEAARGVPERQSEFIERYSGPVLAYLRARWRMRADASWIDDACQDVFVECFRKGGVLERADAGIESFRHFLLGVTKNVARRHEHAAATSNERQPATGLLEQEVGAHADPAHEFEREWARTMIREALHSLRDIEDSRALSGGSRLVELLDLRFRHGWPIRRIAAEWNCPAEQVHREQSRARRLFRRELERRILLHDPGSEEHVDAACARLLALVS